MSPASNRPTASHTIRQLAEQLAHWGESLIVHGRSPLRKIETFPALLTPCGCQNPPLVFWINRDSFMAGAVVLFPDAKDSSILETGRCCAESLGLAYFITWTTSEITFWNARPAVPVAEKEFLIHREARPSAEDFQEGLHRLMEEAKIMSVVGAVPPPELSAHYLANLYRNTLLGVRPLLIDAYRMARASRQSSGDEMSPEILADRKNILTLVRLLSLILGNRSAAIPQPEDLDRALRQSLQTLPEDLRTALQAGKDENPLPEEAAVRFHLLFRRLTQLQMATDGDRHRQALQLLLEHDSRQLGGYPLPFPPEAEKGPVLLLNPDRCRIDMEKPLEIAPPPILAMTALLRHLQGAPAAACQTADLWQLSFSTPPYIVSGTLADRKAPDADTRRAHLAMLRTSWPTRRFALPARTPEWAWQFLHLLGLAKEGAAIELRLPDNWPATEYGRQLIQLVQEQFTIDWLDRDQDGWLLLRMVKAALPDHETRVRLEDDSVRGIPWQKLQGTHPAILSLAMDLPEELWSLLDAGRFRFLEENSWPTEHEEALFLYTRSALGQFFWLVVSNGDSLPNRKSLNRELPAAGLPVPESACLALLQGHFGPGGGPPPSSREIDRELASWLGREPVLPAAPTGTRRRSARQAQPDETELAEQIAELVFVDGIPLFPDHYLFDYYRPQMVEYSFDGPLVAVGQFFDTFELRDARGKSLQVEGAETARSLLLAAATASGAMRVALPGDRQILSAILERYLADLQHLRQNLLRESHRLTADPQKADNLAEAIWKDRKLPPWSLISN